MKTDLPFMDQSKQYRAIADRLAPMFERILSSGQFILGPEVADLETALKDYVGCCDVIGVANGTDAITLALMARALSPGDVVFVPEFTYCATAGAVARMGAIPFFVDVDPETYTLCPAHLDAAIEEAKGQFEHLKGIIAVDLFGVPADYPALKEVADRHGLWLIADAAQSFGATASGRKVGRLTDLTTTSFYPTKPLGCYGDGGAVLVDHDTEAASLIRSLRVHGQGAHRYDHIHLGFNSRLDTLQAAVLIAKLERFDWELSSRRYLAGLYDRLLDPRYVRQRIPEWAESVYAQYTLILPESVDRTMWQSTMRSLGIPTMVYYPTPLSAQRAYAAFPTALKEDSPLYHITQKIVAIPMHAYMDEESTMKIIRATKKSLDLCS